MRIRLALVLVALVSGASACGDEETPTADTGSTDTGVTDTGEADSSDADGGPNDTGSEDVSADAVLEDVGDDGGEADTAPDAVADSEMGEVDPDAQEGMDWDELFAALNMNGCSGGYCHGGGSGGLTFTDADSAYTALIGSRIQATEAACGASERIVAGDANASGLYIRLRPATADSADCTPERMPPDSSGVDPELAEALATWINAGAIR